MLVLIDESGDTGFKVVRGSSPHFVVAMIIFDTYEAAEVASIAIDGARRDARIKGEFKFNKCADCVREIFFRAVARCDFKVRALVVDKSRIYSDNLRESTDKFYNFFVRLLLSHNGGVLKGASIKIDGSGAREFKRELERYLRKQVPPGTIAKMRFADSSRDNLIQLADMAAGAIARSYRNDRKNACRWRSTLHGKLDDVWDFR